MLPQDNLIWANKLEILARNLGVQEDALERVEEAHRLLYTGNVPAETARLLTIELVQPAVDFYGNALLLSLDYAGQPLLDNRSPITPERIQGFRQDLERFEVDNLNLDLRIDKQYLIDRYFSNAGVDYSFTLYLFPSALIRTLTLTTDKLSAFLWPTGDHKAILIVPSLEVALHGPYLAILGGSNLANWIFLAEKEKLDQAKARHLQERARSHLHWMFPAETLQHVTPFHFHVQSAAPEDSVITNLLRVHLVWLTALFTANRSIERDNTWTAYYQGPQPEVVVPLYSPTAPELTGRTMADTHSELLALVEWAYNPDLPPQARLTLVQAAIRQYLLRKPQAERFLYLVQDAPTVLALLKDLWTTFAEDAIKVYLSDIKTLEDSISNTVSSISQQISDMVKAMSDATLAAIATLIGTVVAAIFQEKFRPIIFAMGLGVYAVYLLIFPWLLGMRSRSEAFTALISDYEAKRSSIIELLGKETVARIEGIRVSERKMSFWSWFRRAKIAYGVIVLLTSIACWQAIPGGVVNTALTTVQSISSTSTAAPTAIITATPTITSSVTLTQQPTRMPTALSTATSQPTDTPTVQSPIQLPTTPTAILQLISKPGWCCRISTLLNHY